MPAQPGTPASTVARRTLLVAVAALCAGGIGPATDAVAAPPAASAASTPVEIITPAALRARLDAERGKVVMLALWGTWCAPCLREIPELLELEHEFAASGFVLIGVAMDEPGDAQRLVRPFRDKYFPAFRTYVRATPDMDGVVDVVDPAWNQIVPTNYLIGRDGKVAKKIQGTRPLEELRALVASQPR